MNVIDIEGLGKVYRGKKGMRVEALSDLTLSVPEGEVFGFLGPNGAGKSTTLKILTGLIRPTSGSARICGQDVSSASSRMGVGFLPENPAFYDSLTAEEYLRFVGNAFGMSSSEISSKSVEVLELLGLTDAGRRQIRSYSKGMVQRLGIAQTLLHDPDLYILDEPTTGLDPMVARVVGLSFCVEAGEACYIPLSHRGGSDLFGSGLAPDQIPVTDAIAVLSVLSSRRSAGGDGPGGTKVKGSVTTGFDRPPLVSPDGRSLLVVAAQGGMAMDRDGNAVPRQHAHVELDVVPDLLHAVDFDGDGWTDLLVRRGGNTGDDAIFHGNDIRANGGSASVSYKSGLGFAGALSYRLNDGQADSGVALSPRITCAALPGSSLITSPRSSG